jgi:hypothetical protein
MIMKSSIGNLWKRVKTETFQIHMDIASKEYLKL